MNLPIPVAHKQDGFIVFFGRQSFFQRLANLAHRGSLRYVRDNDMLVLQLLY